MLQSRGWRSAERRRAGERAARESAKPETPHAGAPAVVVNPGPEGSARPRSRSSGMYGDDRLRLLRLGSGGGASCRRQQRTTRMNDERKEIDTGRTNDSTEGGSKTSLSRHRPSAALPAQRRGRNGIRGSRLGPARPRLPGAAGAAAGRGRQVCTKMHTEAITTTSDPRPWARSVRASRTPTAPSDADSLFA